MQALIGVLIVCVVGNVVTIATFIIKESNWRKDFKIQHLKAERRYLVEECLYVLNNINVLINGDIQSTNIRARIGLTLPYDVGFEIYAILDKEWHEDIKLEGEIPYEIQRVLRKPLDEIDKNIKELMS